MKKITFRAECFIDIILFYKLVMKLHEKIDKITIDPNTYISSFMVSDEIDINYYKNISANIVDNHRICQTMRFGNTPNEKWYKDIEFKKQYDVNIITENESMDDFFDFDED